VKKVCYGRHGRHGLPMRMWICVTIIIFSTVYERRYCVTVLPQWVEDAVSTMSLDHVLF